MNQRIDGDGNIQAGGNVHIHSGPSFDPRNSNLMPCPACGRQVSRIADQCPDCADNLAMRRRVVAEKAWNERRSRIMLNLITVAVCAYGVGQLFPSIQFPAMILFGFTVFLIIALTTK